MLELVQLLRAMEQAGDSSRKDPEKTIEVTQTSEIDALNFEHHLKGVYYYAH